MTELWQWTVKEIRDAVADRRVAPSEVVSQFLSRAMTVQEHFPCFTLLEQPDGELGRSPAPLAGVPYAYKDAFASQDRAPSVGVKDIQLPSRASTSTVLQRLRASGAVSLGALNLDPLGYAATGINHDYGTTRNPFDRSRIAGGSSSGPAVAVATGAVPFAIGSDTGGSIRIPAALCGVTGLKPTYGLVSKKGLAPLSYSQDTVGILARSAYDVAIVLDEIAGSDDADPGSAAPLHHHVARAIDYRLGGSRSKPLAGLRIGVDQAYLASSTTGEYGFATLRAVAEFEALGAQICEVDLSRLADLDDAATVLTWAEASAVHSGVFADAKERYPMAARTRLENALVADGADHVNAMRYQGRALAEFLDGPLAEVHQIVVPAATGSAAEISSVEVGANEAVAASLALLRLHRPFNLIGLPTISLPIGLDSLGLPIGLQLADRPFHEARLLTTACAYQSATDWHAIRPTLPTSEAARVGAEYEPEPKEKS